MEMNLQSIPSSRRSPCRASAQPHCLAAWKETCVYSRMRVWLRRRTRAEEGPRDAAECCCFGLAGLSSTNSFGVYLFLQSIFRKHREVLLIFKISFLFSGGEAKKGQNFAQKKELNLIILLRNIEISLLSSNTPSLTLSVFLS